jgi:hypothetical protein
MVCQPRLFIGGEAPEPGFSVFTARSGSGRIDFLTGCQA